MKPCGSKFEYEKERDEDLMSAYHKLVEKASFVSLQHIYDEVVNMPSARFWVSEERAAIVIARMIKGKRVSSMRANKKEMFREIYKRVKVLRKEHPKLTLTEVIFRVLRQPAPKFYLTPGSAKVIICKAKKKWYEERKRKMRHLFL